MRTLAKFLADKVTLCGPAPSPLPTAVLVGGSPFWRPLYSLLHCPLLFSVVKETSISTSKYTDNKYRLLLVVSSLNGTYFFHLL